MKQKRGRLALFLAFLMAAVFCLGALTAGAAQETAWETPMEGTCGEGRTWSFDEGSGTLTISGTGDLKDYNLMDLKYWSGLWGKITSVVIGDGITGIGNRAFADCGSMTSVALPDSVTKIEYGAFDGCYSLPEVKIPDSVTSIGSYAFADCSGLTGVTLPGNVMLIEYDAFAGCSSLPKVEIPASVTKIEGGVFRGCSSLSSVSFKGGAPEISWDRGSGLSPMWPFSGVTADVYYVKDASWTAETMVDYGGKLNWVNRLQIISADADRGAAGMVHAIGSGEDAVIVCSGELEDFVNVAIDGKVLDPAYYRAEKGSTVLAVLAAFLDTLSVGDHTVTLNYTYGSADVVLTVTDKKAAPEKPTEPAKPAEPQKTPNQTDVRKSPQTGERTEGTAWPFILVCACAGGAVLLRWKKRSA